MSFSEINSITSWPRSRSTSATAMPGKRWPPVPPHAITAFMSHCSDWFDVSDSLLNPWRQSGVHRGAFHLRRFKNALPINVHQQTNTEHTRHKVRTSVADERQWQPLIWKQRRGDADIDSGLKSNKRNKTATKQQTET